MKYLKYIFYILLVCCLNSCGTIKSYENYEYIISDSNVAGPFINGIYTPILPFKERIETDIYKHFSWKQAGYTYSDDIQGESVVLFNYYPKERKIKDISLIMPTNIKSVDDELVRMIKKIHFIDEIKNRNVRCISFVIKIRYEKM